MRNTIYFIAGLRFHRDFIVCFVTVYCWDVQVMVLFHGIQISRIYSIIRLLSVQSRFSHSLDIWELHFQRTYLYIKLTNNRYTFNECNKDWIKLLKILLKGHVSWTFFSIIMFKRCPVNWIVSIHRNQF